MNEQEKRIIKDNYSSLQENLLVENLCPYLIENDVITQDDFDFIKSKGSRKRQAEELLQFLNRSPVRSTYNIFLDCLQNAGYEYIVESLESSAAHATSNETYKQTLTSHVKQISVISVNEVPPPVGYFCERKGLTDIISKHLEENGFAILAGIRGSGKTQIARHLIHEETNKQPEGVQMEISARTIGDLCSNIENMTKILNFRCIKEDTSNDEKKIRSGLKSIFAQLKKLAQESNGTHFLLFDDVSKDTSGFITSYDLKSYVEHCNKVKIVITTNNSNIYDNVIMVNGLEKEEALHLYKQNFETTEKDEDILKLSEQLGYLPLGIVVAKKIISRRALIIKTYLQQLHSPTTSQRMMAKEREIFPEKEYNKGLMSALALSIDEIKSSVDPKVFHLYELTALGSHLKFPLNTLKSLMTWAADDIAKDHEIGDLVEAIKDVALGIVTNIREEIYLETHTAVLLAIQLKWTQDQFSEYMSNFFLLMSKICIKDARFSDAFNTQVTLLPHAETALEHFQNYGGPRLIAHQVAEVRLLESIGYMYKQLSLLEKSQYYLYRAKDSFVKYFLNQDASLLQTTDIENDIRQKAVQILEILEAANSKTNLGDFLQFILDHTLQKRECKMWKSILKEESVNGTEDLFRSSTLSEKDFVILQQKNLALSDSQIHRVFLPELLITTLFTLGRVYFYKSSKGESVGKPDRRECESLLKLAYNLCDLVKEKYEVQLLHLKLTKYFGLMFLRMDDIDELSKYHVESIRQIEEDYEHLLEDEGYYFKGGLLREIPKEDYNMAVSLRPLIKCELKLLKYDNKENMQTNYEKCMKYICQLEGILDRNQNLFRVSCFKLYIAKYYAEVAIVGKLHDKFDKALQTFILCCDAECGSGSIRYPWLLALEGLVNLVLKYGIADKDHTAFKVAAKKIKDFLDKLETQNTTYSFEWKKANDLLKEVQNFRESIPVVPEGQRFSLKPIVIAQ